MFPCTPRIYSVPVLFFSETLDSCDRNAEVDTTVLMGELNIKSQYHCVLCITPTDNDESKLSLNVESRLRNVKGYKSLSR
jgi:hypothetical protein